MKREDLNSLAQELNDFTFRILDALHELGLPQDTEALDNFETAADRLVMDLYELAMEDAK